MSIPVLLGSKARISFASFVPQLLRKIFWLTLLLFLVSLQSVFAQIQEHDLYVPRDYYGWLFPVVIDGDRAYVGRDESAIYIYGKTGTDWILTDTIDVNSFSFKASNNRIAVGRNNYFSIYEEAADWAETTQIPYPSFATNRSGFALDGNRLAITYRDDYYNDTSSVYIYDYNGSEWINTFEFGNSSSSTLANDEIIIRKEGENRIFVYKFDGTNWVSRGDILLDSIRAINTDIDGDRIIINTPDAVCYVYEYNGSEWLQTAALRSSDGIPNHEYSYGATYAKLSGDLVALTVYKSLAEEIPQLLVVFAYDGIEWHEKFKINILNGDSEIEPFIDLSGKNLLVSDLLDPIIYELDGLSNPEPAKLIASDGVAHAAFATSSAISPVAAIVGAPYDSEKGKDAGAAYLYKKMNSNWNEFIKLTASDAKPDDQFGFSVDIYARHNYILGADGYLKKAVVGAPFADGKGAVYVFGSDKNSDEWIQIAKLTAPDGMAGDQFGYSVSVFNGNIIVGAPYHDSNGKINSGAVYTYFQHFNTDQWIFGRKTTAPNPKQNDLFGWSVDNKGYSTVVGAPRDDEKGYDAGAAYVLTNTVIKITASDGAAFDRFGTSVASKGPHILVGAPLDDDAGNESGSAYMFEYNNSEYKETVKLRASDESALDRFGSSVAIEENKAVVGASYADHPGGTNAGAAYVYALADSLWTEVGKLTGKARTGDRLGFSVGITYKYIIAGAYHDDDKIKGKDAGSAYIFSAYNLSDLPSTMPAARIYNQDENIQVSMDEVPEKSVHNIPDNPGEIRVFPNPVINQLEVQLNNETVESVEIELLDALGRTIYKKQVLPVNGRHIALDFSEKNIQPGLLFLKIKAPDAATKMLKLMKQ